MSRLPPAKDSSVLRKLEEQLAALDQASNAEDDACNLALEVGADAEAQKHYDECIRLSRERSGVHAKIGAFYDEKARRLEELRKRVETLKIKGGKKTRRRMRGGAVDVWKVVGAVCEALGLKGSCSLATPQPAETKAVEELSPQPFEQWGPPPESPGEEMTFIIPDPGPPPRHPPVQCKISKSTEMRKEAFYLRDVARDLYAKNNKELARKFMDLAKQAYSQACATQELEKNPINRYGIMEKGPLGTLRPGAKGGKTRRKRRNKSRK